MQLPTNGPNQYLRILQYKHSSLICEITRADRGICQKSCDKNLRSDKFLPHRIFLYWHHHTYSPSRFHFLSGPELNFKANWAIIGWLDVWSSLQVPNSSADLASLCRFCGHQFFLADSHPLSLSLFFFSTGRNSPALMQHKSGEKEVGPASDPAAAFVCYK